MIKKKTCPFCFALVIVDDETATMAHEAPECERFAELVRTFGGSEGKTIEVDIP